MHRYRCMLYIHTNAGENRGKDGHFSGSGRKDQRSTFVAFTLCCVYIHAERVTLRAYTFDFTYRYTILSLAMLVVFRSARLRYIYKAKRPTGAIGGIPEIR